MRAAPMAPRGSGAPVGTATEAWLTLERRLARLGLVWDGCRSLEAFVEAARRGQHGGSAITLTVELDQGEMLAGPEWWERLAARWTGWSLRHQRLAAGWARLRAVALWVALAALLLVFVLFPEFRAGLRVWLWLYGLLVAWFVV